MNIVEHIQSEPDMFKETLINMGFQLGNTPERNSKHSGSPCVCAIVVLGASLGEDKYARQKSEKPDKLGICASSKGVGNTWQQFFAGAGEVKFLIC